MAFSEKSLLFLDENHAQNSREWFAAHRDDYEEHVRGPMLELAESLIPTMLKIDPLLMVEPKRALCRIYRDTRFTGDKTVFKRATWLVYQRSKGMTHPVFFFEFTPDFHHYGCGYYATPSRIMGRMRELVLADDKRYREAQRALDSLAGFTLEGDFFKRPRHPDAPPAKRNWLERKSISALRYSEDVKRLFSKNLHKTAAEAYVRLAPIYSFLMFAHEGRDTLP